MPRDALAGRDARTLAREILQMTPEEFSGAFKGSPMKRARLHGLKRNAAVVLGNVGTSADTDVLTRGLGDEEPLAREHAVWTLDRLSSRVGTVAGRASAHPCHASRALGSSEPVRSRIDEALSGRPCRARTPAAPLRRRAGPREPAAQLARGVRRPRSAGRGGRQRSGRHSLPA